MRAPTGGVSWSDPTLAGELTIATAMVAATVLMHYAGLVLLGRLLRVEAAVERRRRIRAFSPQGMLFPVTLVLALFVLHGLEIWLYAGLYVLADAVVDLRTAVYFSTITYAAIGYGDTVLAPGWRIVAAIEGVNGVILLGWSTAFFVTLMTRLMR